MKTYTHIEKGNKAMIISQEGDQLYMGDLKTNERFKISVATLKRWWKESDAKPSDSKQPKQLKMSETISVLEKTFDKLNTIYFEGKLPRAVITVQSTPRAYSHCTTKQIWKSDDTAQYEINLGAEFINRPFENTAATLTHEMVHLYCLENNIADTSQNGRYHNNNFKKEMLARDLEVDYDSAKGYSATRTTEAFINKLKKAGINTNIQFARITQEAKKTANRSKARAYVCPECGQKVKSPSDLNLICGDCEVPMEVQS
ncbi:hypothetical protein FACS189425_09360 [Clostridia bacterium]|nr:hypothetical protein FACS189425_09360 [Clostridia bacterium]